MRSEAMRGANGFSLVEVMVAMLILTVGVLAMAASTGHVFLQLNTAGRNTERSFALQQVAEEIRALPYANVVALPQASARTVGAYRLWWNVDEPTTALKRVTIVSEGPGYPAGNGAVDPAARDTFEISIFRP